jgi:DNA-binding GntR family transcriptional regulator
MYQKPKRLSQLSDLQDELRLDRNLLKDMAVEALRDCIVEGLITEGTKITEREVSQLLDISRMPARDALMILEKEGLVESKSDGRYVVELTERDVHGILEVRKALETLAVELAVANMDEAGRAVLRARLRELEEAVAVGDTHLCTKRDLAIHQEIWRQANNPHLLRILESMLGVIFVLAARVKFYGNGDSERLLNEHRQLVDLIISGDAAGAVQSMAAQLEAASVDSLHTFHVPALTNGVAS